MCCEKCGKPIEDGKTLCDACAAQNDEVITQTDEAAADMGDTFDLNTADQAAQKKSSKKKRRLITAIVALVLVVTCTIGAIFHLDAIKAFMNRTFKDPEVYFVEVESAAIADYTEKLTDSYGKFLDNYQNSPTATKSEIRLTLGDTLMSLLEASLQQQGSQMNLDWLQDIKLSLSTNIQDAAMQYALGIGLGNQDLLTADFILDMKNGKFYGGIPELNQDYLSADLSSEDAESMSTTRLMPEPLLQALPSEEVLGELIETYTDLILSGIKTVDKQDSTITVNGVSLEVLELKATITEADLLDIVKSVLTEARNDQHLKNVVDAYGDYVNEQGKLDDASYEPVDMYQEFVASIDKLMIELDASRAEADSANYMELATYVDMKEQLCGHSLTVYSKGEAPVGPYTWMTVVKDGTTYTEMKLGAIVITGKKTKSNDVANGSYTLSAEGREIGTLELVNVSANNGTLRLVPSDELVRGAMSGANASAALLFNQVSLDLTYSTADTGKAECKLSLMFGSNPLFSLAISSEPADDTEITIPSDALDANNEESLRQWLAEMNFDEVLTALENAGLSQELMETIRGYIAQLQSGMI